MTEAKRHERSPEVASAAERVAAGYRAEFHRLLVAGVVIAVAILALGIVVVYAFDQVPGMARPGAVSAPGL